MRRTYVRVTLGSDDQVLQGDLVSKEDDRTIYTTVIGAWSTTLSIREMTQELLEAYWRWELHEVAGGGRLL